MKHETTTLALPLGETRRGTKALKPGHYPSFILLGGNGVRATETAIFAAIPANAIFHREYDGRTLTYQKLDAWKARVTHDPMAKYVGCVFPLPGQLTVFLGDEK